MINIALCLLIGIISITAQESTTPLAKLTKLDTLESPFPELEFKYPTRNFNFSDSSSEDLLATVVPIGYSITTFPPIPIKEITIEPEEKTKVIETKVIETKVEETKVEEETKVIETKVEEIVEEEESKYTQEEINYLAMCVYAEAGNQDNTGKRLIVDIILNRVSSDNFENTITGVINSPNQFAVVTNKSIYNSPITDEILSIIDEEINNITYPDVLYFRTGHFFDWGTPLFKHGAHYFSK